MAAHLGSDDRYVVGFGSVPLGTRTVHYTDIGGLDTDEEVRDARAAARAWIEIRGSDSRTHFVTLSQ